MDQIDREITEHHLTDAEWGDLTHIQGTIHESVFFYLLDVKTGQARLVTITRDEFFKRDPFADSQPIELFSSLIEQRMRAIGASREPGETDINMLAAGCRGYFRQTQTYRQWLSQAGQNDTLHAGILLYPGSMVRPFAMEPRKMVIPSSSFLALARSLVDADRKAHPEWFAGTPTRSKREKRK